MAKKLISVGLALTIMLFSSISIYADQNVQNVQNVQGDFFIRDVVVNGESFVNYNLQYPFITYNNRTYISLSKDLGKIFGFESSMDWENRTLKLVKTEPSQKNLTNNTYKGDNLEIAVQPLTEIEVLAVDSADKEKLAIDDQAPLLAKGNYVYIPLKMLADSEIFNWDLFYDTYFGICISTDTTIPAKDYWNREQSLYNMGLYSYMKEYNWGLPEAYAQKLAFMFKGAGAVGMMQIMPATGSRYGLSRTQLLDPKISINVGAMIISERIAAYGGDVVKGLSAYNQGSVTVNRGSYSTSYSSRVLSANAGVNNFLATNGYIAK